MTRADAIPKAMPNPTMGLRLIARILGSLAGLQQLQLLVPREPRLDRLRFVLAVGRAPPPIRNAVALADLAHSLPQPVGVGLAHLVIERVRRPVALREMRKLFLDERQV